MGKTPTVVVTDRDGHVQIFVLASETAYVHEGERFPRYDLTEITPDRAA